MEMEATSNGTDGRNNDAKRTAKVRPRPLPAETWLQVVSFLGPKVLVDSVSLTPLRPFAFSRLHLDGPPRLLPFLLFCRDGDGGGAMLKKAPRKTHPTQKWSEIPKGERRWSRLPIPDCEPSQNIVGFDRIEISFFDHQVLAFLRSIQPRLLTDVNLEVSGLERRGGPRGGYQLCRGTLTVLAHLQALLAHRVRSLLIRSEFFKPILCRFPALCQGVRLIELDMLNESMVGPLERWLSGQGEEARKLVLAECQKEAGANLVAKLRENFVGATCEGRSYFVRLCSEFHFSINELEEDDEVEEEEGEEDSEEEEEDEEEETEEEDEDDDEEEDEVKKYFNKYIRKGKDKDYGEEEESEDDEDEEEDEAEEEEEEEGEEPEQSIMELEPFALNNDNSGECLELRRLDNKSELLLSRWAPARGDRWRGEQEAEVCGWALYGYNNRKGTLFIGNCQVGSMFSASKRAPSTTFSSHQTACDVPGTCRTCVNCLQSPLPPKRARKGTEAK